MIALNTSRITLVAAGVLAIWLALHCSTARQARLDQDELNAKAADAARLQRMLERQARQIERLQTRLVRQQLEIDACGAEPMLADDRRAMTVSYREPSSSLVVLSQVDDRVEVAPGGPMAPIAQ